MALDFPASPTVGQKYPSPAVTGVPVYTWDGEKWTTLGGAIGSTGASDAIPLIDAGTGAAGSSTLWSRGDHAHPPITTSPTPPAGDNDTSIATTAFVSGAISTAVGGIPGAPSAVVRYDIAQTLTAPQLIQARQNIYAAPFDAMAYGGLQINGGMEVSQELGSTGTQTNGKYICDGWKLSMSGSMVLGAAQGFTANLFPGLSYFLGVNVLTAEASIAPADFAAITQPIEGWRIARLQWGTPAAQPITIGFWSMHHRPGLYSVVARGPSPNRTYVATYTQAAADAKQYNTITIPGDTTGTWPNDNSVGLAITFALSAGTGWTAPAANTWYSVNYVGAPGQVNAVATTSDVFIVSGVTVHPGNEAPSAARSPFVMRPYDQELVTCKRYWERSNGGFRVQSPGGFVGGWSSFAVEKRAIPTCTFDQYGTQGGIGTFQSFLATTTKGTGVQFSCSPGTDCYSYGFQLLADARL